MPETRSFTFVGQISPIRGNWSLAEPIVVSIGSDSIGPGQMYLDVVGLTVGYALTC